LASSRLSIWHFGHFILSPLEIFLIENVERKNKRTLYGYTENILIMVQCQLYDISGFEGLEIVKVCMEYQRCNR